MVLFRSNLILVLEPTDFCEAKFQVVHYESSFQILLNLGSVLSRYCIKEQDGIVSSRRHI